MHVMYILTSIPIIYFYSEVFTNEVTMQRIWGQVKQNTLLLQEIHRRVVDGQLPSVVSPEEFGLPMQSIDDFRNVKTMLGEKLKHNALVCTLYIL